MILFCCGGNVYLVHIIMEMCESIDLINMKIFEHFCATMK